MSDDQTLKNRFAIVVHGGVNGGVAKPGTEALPERGQISAEEATEITRDLNTAVNNGFRLLAEGESAVEAVVAAVSVLEDSPHFDAGRGSIQTTDGTYEMDACLMAGPTRSVGAVAAVTRLKNPIHAARAFLESREVLVVGPGAEKKALTLDPSLETRAPSYFAVKSRYHQDSPEDFPPHGTVGAVALDREGNLAAATSTGGYPGKIPGRIGDSPLVGAGTFASRDVAISATGIGEYFMRYNIAQTIAQRMQYLNEPLDLAAKNTFDDVYAAEGLENVEIDIKCLKDRNSSGYGSLKKILTKLNTLGLGGVIGIDKYGNIIEYFKFSAFARGHRTNADPLPIVRLDGPVDR